MSKPCGHIEDDRGTVEKRPLEPELPTEYQDYQDVFDTIVASILLEHYPIEYKIELENRGIPPWSPIYTLSKLELKVL